jgi:hypothetical protein
MGRAISIEGREKKAADGSSHVALLPKDNVPRPLGCPPVAAGQCGVVLRKAIREAINLANNAASKLEVASKLELSQRDAATKETARLFKGFFGHDPTMRT